MWIASCRAALIAAGIAAAAGVALGARQVPSPASDRGLTDAATALQAGTFDRAVALATAYLKRHPADTGAHVLLARVDIARDDLDAAFLELRRALDADARNVDALYYLGTVAARLSQQSFADLQRAAPDSARVHQLLAEGLEAQDRRDAAAKEYEAALARQPDLLDALLGLARLRRIALACDEAVLLYRRLRRRDLPSTAHTASASAKACCRTMTARVPASSGRSLAIQARRSPGWALENRS